MWLKALTEPVFCPNLNPVSVLYVIVFLNPGLGLYTHSHGNTQRTNYHLFTTENHNL